MSTKAFKTSHLNFFNLPQLGSLDDISKELRLSKKLIFNYTKFQGSFYKTYSIPKKSGGSRIISQPNKSLKSVQAWILHNILYKIKSSEYSQGFDLGNSIAENAQQHIGNNCIVNIDIKNYFDTISFKRVYKLFLKIGYNGEASFILARLCTFNDSLPQGAPTSSKLANLISWNLDLRIAGYTSKKGFNYSRYADDISISGYIPHLLKNCVPKIFGILKDEGFEVNHKKTRVQDLSGKRSVTGLILYDETYGIGTNAKKLIRSKIHKFLTNPLAHNDREKNCLDGWFNYLNSVDKKRMKQLSIFASKILSQNTSLKQHQIKFAEERTKKNARKKGNVTL